MAVTIRTVRCIDNILQRDALTWGQVYEQIGDEKDGYVQISGLGRFSAARFEPVESKEPRQ